MKKVYIQLIKMFLGLKGKLKGKNNSGKLRQWERKVYASGEDKPSSTLGKKQVSVMKRSLECMTEIDVVQPSKRRSMVWKHLRINRDSDEDILETTAGIAIVQPYIDNHEDYYLELLWSRELASSSNVAPHGEAR